MNTNEINNEINIVYRLGTKQDLDAICLLIRQAINEMEKHEIYQWDDIYPARMDVISDECDEQYANGQWKYDDKNAYILHRFCVSPLFQNKGLGKTVLLHVEEQIKEMGYQSVRLDTFTENPFAQKLYLHNGYESRGYANWRKGKFDLMEKKLI